MAKRSSDNWLKELIEKSPLVTFCTVAIAVGSTIYGAINWMYASKHEVEIERMRAVSQRVETELKRQYQDKVGELEQERSRIRFTVNDLTSFLDLKSLVVDEEQLGLNYRRFRPLGIAVPVSVQSSSAWSWKETTEFEIVSASLDQATSSSLFSDGGAGKQLQDILQRTKVQSYEGPIAIDVKIAGAPLNLRARSIFGSVSKADLDYVSTIANQMKVNSLFASLDSFNKTLKAMLSSDYQSFYVRLMNELFPLDKPLAPKSVATVVDAETLGKILCDAAKPEQVDEVLAVIATKVSSDKSTSARMAYEICAKEKIDDASKEAVKSKTESDMVPITKDMDFYYATLFSGTYAALLEFGEKVSVSEIGLNKDYFVVKGSADLGDAGSTSVRVYFLRICVRRNDRLYYAGYLIPSIDNLDDVKTAMSMVSGFKILK
ncbi:hypothetical protein [Bradyrhizobium japonicum]|uniref:hypothetical protein n=1 Tax=Bradyrhizobium japonicum TaxID=375 RepID=UPI001BA98600|nr:hypothetical protein [Bradyrhizobium japonicum]MBR0962081.1 hypothetical protein [Bradyrhizobium japonicum]